MVWLFKQFVPDLEYSEIIAELREQFIEKKYACYRHEVVSKTGEIRMIVAFFTIQNKLLNRSPRTGSHALRILRLHTFS